MGTVDYVAPEQIKGEEVDGRADVYSLGCVLYECLTGHRPFERDTEVATLYAHLEDPAPRPSAKVPDVPAGLDAVVATAMAKRPDVRYPSAGAMATMARAALAPSPTAPVVAARRQGWLLAAGVALVALAVQGRPRGGGPR
jgi:serine/threonine protein kinase